MTRATRPAAVVFDCDGLLVDSAACWEAAYRAGLGAQSRELTDELADRLNGASIRIAADLLGIERDELGRLLAESFATEALRLRPGALELLARIGDSAPLAVATNGPRWLAAGALERLEIADRFTAILSAETMRDKPAPDVYLAACDALGVDPGDAVAFEDSVLGAAAARAAGLTVVFVSSRGQTSADSDLEASRLDDPEVLRIFEP